VTSPPAERVSRFASAPLVGIAVVSIVVFVLIRVPVSIGSLGLVTVLSVTVWASWLIVQRRQPSLRSVIAALPFMIVVSALVTFCSIVVCGLVIWLAKALF